MSARGATAGRREARWVAVLAFAAALRVLFFSASFPFFTNVDEHRHVDMAIKYARGALPRPDAATYEPILGALIADYGSPEYALPPGRAVPPPTWSGPDAARSRRVALQERLFGRARNLEILQSPVYYAAAGGALALARGAGLDWGRALYGVRALNALALAALVLVAWALLRRSHPRDALVRIGAPGLLAVMPLDALYYVTGDALSPLTGGLAFAALAGCAIAPALTPAAFAAAGVASALAVLTKATNVAVAVLAVPVSVRVVRGGASARARAGRVAALWLGLGVPLGAWMARSDALTGSWLGTAAKVEGLGWGRRAIGDWWGHPLLSPSGLVDFLGGLVPIFWRGEVVWHRTVLASPAADAFYTASSGLLLLAALVALRERGPGAARAIEAAAAVAVAGAVAVLMGLSLRFVFSETTNPTAERPWFDQGRLISGVWLPFAVLYVRGIERVTRPLGPRAPGLAWALLALVALVCLGSEIWISRPVFSSPYNLFHLP